MTLKPFVDRHISLFKMGYSFALIIQKKKKKTVADPEGAQKAPL